MKHVIIPPPPQLSPYIKCFWAFEYHHTDGKNLQISTFVKDASGITIVANNKPSMFNATLQGQFTRPQVFRPFSYLNVCGVLFYPQGVNALFGMHAGELTNQEIQLNDVAGWNIADALFNAADVKIQLGILTKFLTGLAKRANPADNLIQDCIYTIQAKKGLLTVAGLQEQYAVSERQLERRFMAAMGVSPRHYLKVIRFGEALHLMRSNDKSNLTDIAYALNYSDQSHFIRHVKQLSGFTPAALQKKLRELPVNQVGSTPYLIGKPAA